MRERAEEERVSGKEKSEEWEMGRGESKGEMGV